MKKSWSRVAGVAGAGLVVAAGLLWWNERSAPVPVVATPFPTVAPPTTPAVAATASEPAIKHPIEEATATLSPQGPAGVASALDALFGSKAVQEMFRPDDFARRFVATIDNLGRSQAPAAMWPVEPPGGQVIVERRDDAESLGDDNGLRYTPYVLLLETLDLRRAAAAYAQLYPHFQQAYEDLGYPNRYFNDRLVEVLDLLLATPQPSAAPKIHMPQVSGPLQPQRPWLLYRFDDPSYEALPSGQKLLLRMGPVNQRRIKTRLADFRRLVTSSKSARAPLKQRKEAL